MNATPPFGNWPPIVIPTPPPPVLLVGAYAEINGDGSVNLQQPSAWIDSVDTPSAGVYVLHIHSSFQNPQNSAQLTVRSLTPSFISGQFPTDDQLQVQTWDSTGAAANRFFAVVLLVPPA